MKEKELLKQILINQAVLFEKINAIEAKLKGSTKTTGTPSIKSFKREADKARDTVLDVFTG